jgi:hypothetical protein
MTTKITPQNLTAQMNYAARGNPPNTRPAAAVSNCFPGLEFDFRNLWKNFLVGVEFHEAMTRVIRVQSGSEAAAAGVTTNHDLVSIGGFPVRARLVGPDGPSGQTRALEWSNALADVLTGTDRKPECRFEIVGSPGAIIVRLPLRPLFNNAEIPVEVAEPGALTQSLCSPWQADYRECMCFYWASSRPDFVNVEIDGGQVRGNNWMDRDRSATAYISDDGDDPALLNYDDLYRNWERLLRFQIGGKDE